MASGKSLELREIRPKPPQLLCKCGKEWETHLGAKGQVLKRFDSGRHAPLSARRHERGRRFRLNMGFEKSSAAQMKKSEHWLAKLRRAAAEDG